VVTDTKDVSGLVDHLFRREAGKMVSYLTRVFGVGNLRMAEDVVQDTLLRALETWPVYGVPENPAAWLMRVARNRAIDIVRRDGRFRHIAPEVERELGSKDSPSGEDAAFANEIRDDQLRMMFSCCHPSLSTDAQMTLILKALCGFGVDEISHALLASEDSIEKRLSRARNVLRSSGDFVEIATAPDMPERLEAVYRAVYLLFNEGYHGTRSEETVREELCFEAIRLALLLSEHPESAGPRTYALLALFCFQVARLSGFDRKGILFFDDVVFGGRS
jgi:RNA polymerase sigma factor (sigma-70 family)